MTFKARARAEDPEELLTNWWHRHAISRRQKGYLQMMSPLIFGQIPEISLNAAKACR